MNLVEILVNSGFEKFTIFKPCPFCGNIDLDQDILDWEGCSLTDEEHDDDDIACYGVSCSCGASMLAETRADLIDAWNNRTGVIQ